MDQHDPAPLRVDRAAQLDRRAVEPQDAPGRREVAAEDLHQRRFAGAVLADDRVGLPADERDVTSERTSIGPNERDSPTASSNAPGSVDFPPSDVSPSI